MKKILLNILFLFLFFTLKSQQLFYSNTIYGGVTGVGFTAGANSDTTYSDVLIPPNSTIEKAFLIATTDSTPQPITVTLNNIDYTFDTSTIVTSHFTSLIIGGIKKSNSSIRVLDITNDIDSSITNYAMYIPYQSLAVSSQTFFSHFYLYIIYENITLPKIAYNLVLNTQDVNLITYFNLNNLQPIKNTQPVGLALLVSHFCDTTSDGSFVSVNGNTLGLIGGLDSNSPSGCGVYANFAYYNDSLFGLDDDTPDSLMASTDALADIKSYVTNGDTAVNITFTKQSGTGLYTNPIRAVMLSYTTPCDTFTTAATTNQDTICIGESVQLNASGGAIYNWFSAFSTFNDSTLVNPIATPTQTTTYIVSIKNDSGCVKTEHVKVWVHFLPKPDTITITPQRCGSANGSITIGTIPNGTPPFNYQLTNLQTLVTSNQQLATFSNLSTNNYQLIITDSNGCQWQSDTLLLPEINDITANFSVYTLPWVFPFSTNPMGEAPLTVYTQNSSVNAGSFEWWVVSDESGIRDTIALYSTLNTQHTFEDGGTFEICLFAYNNLPTCGDTVCKTIGIAPNSGVDSLVFVVPNVFSPNHDGNNDNFVLQLQGADLLQKIEVEIFNRWGQQITDWKLNIGDLISNLQLPISNFVLWDGTTNSGTKVPEGTYFYVVSYTKLSGESESLKGTIMLLR